MSDLPAWGLHVTEGSIRGVKIEVVAGSPRITAFDRVDFYEDIEDLTSLDRHAALAHAIAVFSKRHDMSRCRVYASVDASTAFNRFVSAPMVKGESLTRILAYEAQQQIPFDLEGVYWDHKVLDVRQGDAEADVLLFALRKEVADERIRRFDKLNVPLDGVQLAPVALYNFAVQEHLAKDGYVMVAIDLARTDILLFHGKRLWFRSLPTGFHKMFGQIAEAFGVKHRKAVKIASGELEAPDKKRLEEVKASTARRLAKDVARMVAYYGGAIEGVKLKGIVLVPGSAMAPSLGTHLKEETNLEVYAFKGFRRTDMAMPEDVVTDVAGLSHATGLALQATGTAAIDIKLFPEDLERVFAGRRIFYALSLACILFMLLFVSWRVDSQKDLIADKNAELGLLIDDVAKTNEAMRETRREAEIKDKIMPYYEIGKNRLVAVDAADTVLSAFRHFNEGKSSGERLYMVELKTLVASKPSASRRRVEFILGLLDTPDSDKNFREQSWPEFTKALTGQPGVEGLKLGPSFLAADLASVATPDIESRIVRRRFRMFKASFEFDDQEGGRP